MPTYPQRTFIDVNDGQKGIALLNCGLPEYEVKDNKERTIALTLLRCVQWITAPDPLTIRSHRGDPFWRFSPEGQCQKKYTFHYSLYPHSGTWKEGKVYKQAYEHNLSCRVIQADKHRGKLPESLSFISLKPEEIIVSAFKKAEERNSLILRLYNISDREVQVVIDFYKKVERAFFVNFKEERKKKLRVHNGIISFDVPGKKIFTLELVPS